MFACVAMQLYSHISYEDQLNHIKSQMRTLKRAWQIEQVHITLAQKTAPVLYQTLKTAFDKILSNEIFTNKLENAITSQFDSIVNNNMSFINVKTEFNLSDFFPNVTMADFGKKLFSAMANKTCYLELGKRLAQKVQELQMIVASSPTLQY